MQPGEHATTSMEMRARAVAAGAGAQVAGKGVHFLLNVVATLAVIRHLGTGGYGDYVFAITFATLVGLISDLGISKVAARDMSVPGTPPDDVLGTAIACRLALAVLCWLLAQGILFVLATSWAVHVAVAVASLLFVGDALLSVVVVFQVRLAMQYDAVVSVIGQTVDTGLILLLVHGGAGLIALLAAPVAGTAVGIAVAIAITRRAFRARPRFRLELVPRLLIESLPIGLALLLAATYLKVDAVIIAVLRSSREVAIYGAAYRPIEYSLLAATLLIAVMFPLLARAWVSDRAEFKSVYQRGGEFLLAMVLPIPAVLIVIGKPLVENVYAPAFAATALPLAVLGPALVLMVVNAWQAFCLLAGGRQRIALAYDAAALVVNLALNLILVPRLGYMGAAVAAGATAVFVTACAGTAVRRLLGVSLDTGRVARLLVAGFGFAGVLWLLVAAGIAWWAAPIIAATSYPLWLLGLRLTSLGEVIRLLPRPAPAVASS